LFLRDPSLCHTVVSLRSLRYPLGRRFPKGKLFVEHQRAAVPDTRAIDLRDVTTQDACGDAKKRYGITDLHLHAHTGQETPIRLDERAAR